MYREIQESFRAIFEGIVIVADEKILHEKTSQSMIFISKKAKPGRVNAEFNFTCRIFFVYHFLTSETMFF